MEKIKQTNIIELQYTTGMSRSEIKNLIDKKNFFFQFSKNWVWRVGKTKNKKL